MAAKMITAVVMGRRMSLRPAGERNQHERIVGSNAAGEHVGGGANIRLLSSAFVG